jgi:hypothetical protein
MNQQERRQILAHGAMGLAACVGAYMVLVDGPRKQLVNAHAEEQALTEQVRTAEGLRDRVPAMTAALDQTTRQANDIKDMGRLAREERGLFGAVMSLAGTHHVRLDELNPAKIVTGPARGPGLPGQATPPAAIDTAVGYTMVAVASYEDLAAFTAAIRGELGYSVIRAIRLTPVQDERAKLVRAVIETEHYSFDTSPPAVADAGAH